MWPLSVSYCEEDNAWGLHRVFWGKHDSAVVNPAIEIGIWGPAYGEVPFKEVILHKERHVILSPCYIQTCSSGWTHLCDFFCLADTVSDVL